jgi:protease I
MEFNLFGGNEKDIMAAAPVPQRLEKAEKILILTADNTEDMEFFYPYYRFMEAGYHVDVAIPEGTSFKAKNGYNFKQAMPLEDVNAADYRLLYIPGGKAPATLRKELRAVEIVTEFARAGKTIAAICHGPQLLIEAGLVSGRKMSGYDGIQEELEEAGAQYVDEALVIDGQFITARLPGDLHRHMSGVMEALQGINMQRNVA